MASSSDSQLPHPYYPRTLHLPHYSENALPIHVVLAAVVALFAVAFSVTWALVGRDRYGRRLPAGERAVLCWFGMSGFIHVVLEGYLTLTSDTIAGNNSILAQIWKEYSKGDSRYVSNDTCTIVMECVTAWVEGPGCFLIVYAHLTRHPMRHVLQLAVSIGQLYGVVLYFLTEYVDGFVHGPIYHPVYFWLYVVGFNAPWALVPPLLVRRSWRELCRAQTRLDLAEGTGPDAGESDCSEMNSKKRN